MVISYKFLRIQEVSDKLLKILKVGFDMIKFVFQEIELSCSVKNILEWRKYGSKKFLFVLEIQIVEMKGSNKILEVINK